MSVQMIGQMKCRQLLVMKYVDRKGTATILTTMRSEGVTPKVNLSNLLYTGNEAPKVRESTQAL